MSVSAPAPVQLQSRFLETGLLDRLSHLKFAARYRIEGSYSGRHRSRQRGGSAEFVDYRQYVPGEDIRRIDWKVLGRTERPYVRLYQDETNLRCTIMVDASGSMNFAGYGRGSLGSKLSYAQYLATALSYLIGAQRDQVGLAIAADGLRDFLPPAGTSTHIRQLQRKIESISTEPATDLPVALHQTFDRLTRRGVLMIISDFLVDDFSKLFSSLRLFRHRRFDVIALHLVHPDEEQLPESGAYRFEGLENDGQVDCTAPQVRDAYENAFAAHISSVRGVALSAGCDYRRISLTTHYIQTLMGFLVEREG
jgi:uncharacterized protein (DUF58 family)